MNKRIFLAGDSTCADKAESVFPEKGWGQVLSQFIDNYEIVNCAVNGRSSRSFIEEGRLDKIQKEISPGDLLLIQFGHNDQKDDPLRKTDPFSSYQDCLLQYINTAREKGAIPILLTSVSRRLFNSNDVLEDFIHGDFPQAMRELAERENVLLIDIYRMSREWLDALGEKKSREYFMFFPPGEYENYCEGLSDNTHLVSKGAGKIASWVAENLKTFLTGLNWKKNYLKAELQEKSIHGGFGKAKSVKLFGADDLVSDLKYVSYTHLEPDSSIGYHVHPDLREEFYVILQGRGEMTIDGISFAVEEGDVIFTPSGKGHGLVNSRETNMKLFIFWVKVSDKYNIQQKEVLYD